ncbi:MAG: flagellar biosynthesis protein FlhB [Spirochaetales bacterium]|nr:flagellar biosynthesis protein FlhB [Spirochaetales bacterium]
MKEIREEINRRYPICVSRTGFRTAAEPSFCGIHIQWFAKAEDEGRTEEPTEHKIRKAREEGKVAKSGELTSALILLVAIVTIGLLSSYLLQNSIEMLKYFIERSCEIDITRDFHVLPVFLTFFMKLALPVLLICFIAAFLGNVLQVGFLFTVKPIIPDFNKIIPRFGKFIQRAFLSTEALFNLGKSVFKIIIIGLIAFLNLAMEIKKIAMLMNQHFMISFGLFAFLAFRIVIESAIALLVLSIFDYFFQRRKHLESLKMTKQEVKEERKMYEGDPLVKSRLRQKMQELLKRNMLKEVPKADVVITNPTHYAIALQWKKETMVSPTVVAKGADHMAYKIRETAEEHGIPVVENKPLARALFLEVDIGDSIPEKFYEVVALILAQVMKLGGKRYAAV